MTVAIKYFDFTVLEGERSVEKQRLNVQTGISKTMDSRHLDRPARAVDIAPWPIKWPDPEDDNFAKDLARWYYLGGLIRGMAIVLGIPIRWGGDWDSDGEVNDQTFDDLGHFELPKPAGVDDA